MKRVLSLIMSLIMAGTLFAVPAGAAVSEDLPVNAAAADPGAAAGDPTGDPAAAGDPATADDPAGDPAAAGDPTGDPAAADDPAEAADLTDEETAPESDSTGDLTGDPTGDLSEDSTDVTAGDETDATAGDETDVADDLIDEEAGEAPLMEAAVTPNVTYHTQAEIRAFVKSHPITNTPFAYKTQPSTTEPYAAGELTDEVKNDGLNALNVVRYIAGLPANVTLNSSYSQACQAGALVNAANGVLSHGPSKPEGMSDSLYNLGCSGTSQSNLAMGYGTLGGAVIGAWMHDGDSSNIDRVGHRRWCLNPAMKQTGFGAVGSFSAMFAFDGAFGSTSLVSMWPGQTMPVNYFSSSYPWSYSTGQSETASKIRVTLTKQDGTVWTFSQSASDGYFNVNNGGYGLSGCIIFRPNNVTYAAGDVFKVTIEGTQKGTVSYTVTFFNLYEKPITALTLTGTTHNIAVGETIKPEVVVTPSDTDEPVVFGPNSSGMLSVNSDGTITGLAPGYATMWVTNQRGDIYASQWYRVYKPVESVSLDKTNLVLKIGASDYLTATYSPSDSMNLGTTWTSSDESVATVDSYGRVTGVSGGKAVITCTSTPDGHSASCPVTVLTPMTDSRISVTVNPTSYIYDGKAKTPAVTVRDSRTGVLKAGTDYQLEYRNNVSVGNASVIITGLDTTGSRTYTGSRTEYFAITKRPSEVVVTCADITYGQTPAPKVTKNVSGGAVTFTYSKDGGKTFGSSVPVNAGTYIVKASAAETADYQAAESTVSFTIKPASISAASVTVSGTFTYNGSAQTPSCAVKLGSKTLSTGTDYIVSYRNNVNAGTAAVTVTGKGNYTGTAQGSFVIRKKAIQLSVTATSPVYGTPIRTGCAVSEYDSSAEISISYSSDGGKTYSAAAPVNAGSYIIKASIPETVNYLGAEATSTFTIKKGTYNCSISCPDIAYGLTPSPDVAVVDSEATPVFDYSSDGGKTYRKTVPENAGTYRLRVTIPEDANHVALTTTRDFKITPIDLAKARIKILDKYTYNGEPQTPVLQAECSLNKGTNKLSFSYTAWLVAGTDYELSLKDNVNAGQATLTLKGKGNFTGSKTTTFTILPADLADTDVTVTKARVYTGKAITDGVKVQHTATLKQGTDYTVSFKNNTEPGVAAVTVTGKGNYAGSVTKPFYIRRFVKLAGADRYETGAAIAGETYPGGASEVIIVTGQKFPDALAANAYAGLIDAPVLLSRLNELPSATEQLLRSWKGTIKHITIIGGGFSDQTLAGIKAAAGLSNSAISTIAGENRYKTAELICGSGLGESPEGGAAVPAGGTFSRDVVIIAKGGVPADALSVAPWSHRLRIPILLAHGLKLDASTEAYVRKFGKVILLGDVEESCACGRPVLTRLQGTDRYATSSMVAEYFIKECQSGLFAERFKSSAKAASAGPGYNKLAFADGRNTNFPDALAGGMLQSLYGAPVILNKPGLAEQTKLVIDSKLAALPSPQAVYSYYFLGTMGKEPAYDELVREIQAKD